MAKLENYDGSIELISGLKQKNAGDFPLLEAHAIQTKEDGTRLDAELELLRQNTGGGESDGVQYTYNESEESLTFSGVASDAGVLVHDGEIESNATPFLVSKVDESGKRRAVLVLGEPAVHENGQSYFKAGLQAEAVDLKSYKIEEDGSKTTMAGVNVNSKGTILLEGKKIVLNALHVEAPSLAMYRHSITYTFENNLQNSRIRGSIKFELINSDDRPYTTSDAQALLIDLPEFFPVSLAGLHDEDLYPNQAIGIVDGRVNKDENTGIYIRGAGYDTEGEFVFVDDEYIPIESISNITDIVTKLSK